MILISTTLGSGTKGHMVSRRMYIDGLLLGQDELENKGRIKVFFVFLPTGPMDYSINLRASLDKSGFTNTKIVLPDDGNIPQVFANMKSTFICFRPRLQSSMRLCSAFSVSCTDIG